MLSSFKTTFVTVNQNFPIDREEAYKNSKTTFVTVNLPIIVPPLSLSLIQKQLLLLLIFHAILLEIGNLKIQKQLLLLLIDGEAGYCMYAVYSKTTFVTVNLYIKSFII